MKARRFTLNLLLAVMALGLSRCKTSESFYTNVLRSDVFVQQYDNRNYDFLWVMDNSGSMTDRRQYVRDNLQRFVNILNSRKAVNYQMAVTTTDQFTTAGNLISAPGGLQVVKSATSSNPVADMATIINNVQDSPTSFWEQGLESAYQAVLNHKAQFSRNGVPLTVIIISDSDDWSCQDNCWGVEPENNPNWTQFPLQRYIDYFQNVKSPDNSEAYVFAITGVASSTCQVEFQGARFEGLVSALGGISSAGSVCLSQIQQTFDGIARTLADRGVKFTLSTPASQDGINVFVDGRSIPFSADNGWVFEAADNAVVFTGLSIPPNGSVVEVTYNETQP